MTTQYRVIHSSGLCPYQEIESDVNDAISSGWIPIGGVSISHSMGNYIVLTQAIVKTVDGTTTCPSSDDTHCPGCCPRKGKT